MNSICGTWRVIDGEVFDAESHTRLLVCAGGLRYAPDGSFVARCVLVPEANDGGADAAAERFEYEYSGHYEVDAERGVIAHRILSSSFPDDIGTTAYRSFQRTGAFLSVAFPVISAGEEPNRNCSYGFISLQREES